MCLREYESSSGFNWGVRAVVGAAGLEDRVERSVRLGREDAKRRRRRMGRVK